MKHVKRFINFSVKFNWLIHALRMPNGNEEHRNYSFWFIFLSSILFLHWIVNGCYHTQTHNTHFMYKKRSFFAFLVARGTSYWTIGAFQINCEYIFTYFPSFRQIVFIIVILFQFQSLSSILLVIICYSFDPFDPFDFTGREKKNKNLHFRTKKEMFNCWKCQFIT